MAWLPLYLSGSDYEAVLKILNEDSEIAFIVSDGEGRWKAVESLNSLHHREQILWHKPSGKLPLLVKDGRTEIVVDPYDGWMELHKCADPTIPFFGGHAGVVSLTFCTCPYKENNVPMSSFGWIGNYYRVLGCGAEKTTEQWWKRLRATVKRMSVKVPRGGPQGSGKAEVFAVPGAVCAFEEGRLGDINPCC